MLTGGFGSDRLDGGSGNDTLLSRSDAGEMVAAQDGHHADLRRTKRPRLRRSRIS